MEENNNKTINPYDYTNYSPYTYKNENTQSSNRLNETSNLKDNYEKMKNMSLEDKEKIQRINTRNNKLRNFLKEIKTDNKNIGIKNINDFSKLFI